MLHLVSSNHLSFTYQLEQFVHLVVGLEMLFTEKLLKTCLHLTVKNVNHFYIAIVPISVFCLTAFEIISTTTLHMPAWSYQMICCFSIDKIAVGVTPEQRSLDSARMHVRE